MAESRYRPGICPQGSWSGVQMADVDGGGKWPGRDHVKETVDPGDTLLGLTCSFHTSHLKAATTDSPRES